MGIPAAISSPENHVPHLLLLLAFPYSRFKIPLMLPAPIPDNEPERIASLRRMLILSTPDEEAIDRVTRTAQHLFDTPIALLSLIDSQRQWFKSCIGLPVRETGRDVSFCGHAIMDDALFVVEDATADPRFADNPLVTGDPRVIFYAGRPLHNADGHRVGTLCVIDHEPRHFSEKDRHALNDLGYWLEAVFVNRELSEAEKAMLEELDEARRTSLLDPMLNIWNRGAAMQMLDREVQRAFRNKGPLSLLMVDIDHFKAINDNLGHPAGDAVLIEFAKRMRSLTRAYDVIGRYGGDEFMIILPETDASAALPLAQRLLKAITLAPFIAGEEAINVTASLGLATSHYPDETLEMTTLIERADQALLAAKRAGRNQVMLYTAPPGAA
jgi:diguanylate cyclase (GGDEF)-like protein